MLGRGCGAGNDKEHWKAGLGWVCLFSFLFFSSIRVRSSGPTVRRGEVADGKRRGGERGKGRGNALSVVLYLSYTVTLVMCLCNLIEVV